MFRVLSLVIIVLLIPIGFADASAAPRTITWDDLIPGDARYPANPLHKLSGPQREMVGFILRARNVMMRTGRGEHSEMALEVAEREKRLRKEGVDVDTLVARVREVEAASRDADDKVNSALNRKYLRMPGYMLPLEFAGSKVTEFLLVPFVGACLHVPPPPPNQVVHVRTTTAIDITGLYTPVYVSGYMRTRSSTAKSIFLTDGNVDVSYGYTMLADDVEIYDEGSGR